jgi:hypothetical protein
MISDIPKPTGFYETTDPDGTVKTVTPRDCAAAWAVADLNEELENLCRVVADLEVGDEVEITGYLASSGKRGVVKWKRIR